ncbi:MAG: hypothetical protein JW822_12100 [Spirochaetales bacterium]|nr:hypothetical protein [Spirochaetales bacterium]
MSFPLKIRIRYFLLILIITAVAFISAGPSFGTPLSILSYKDQLAEINKAYFHYLELLKSFNDNKLAYFKRGLGWHNNNYYGFEIGSYGLYFSRDQLGIKEYDDQGNVVASLHLGLDKPVHYAGLEIPGKYKMGLSVKNGSIHWLEWSFSDGSAIAVNEDLIRVSYADKEYYYMLYYHNDEPTLSLSPKLAHYVFDSAGSDSTVREIVDQIYKDFPYLYYTRILKDALKAKVNIKDQDALAYFSINWFRQAVGLDALPANELLKKAAQNHADYLIANNVVGRMLSWDAKSINMNDYLEIHSEVTGKKLFTGQRVTDRTEHAGYGRKTSETANISKQEALSSVIGWFHSIYHRRPIIDIRCLCFGYAQSRSQQELSETANIANWGYDWQAKSEKIYFYPMKNEKLVPYAWSGFEAPDPFPNDKSSTGPPITASFAAALYKNGSLSLFDQNGKKVPCLSTNVLPAENNFLEITPADPLDPDSRYTVKYEYAGGSVQYDFHTAPINPAEVEIRKLVRELQRSFDLRDPGFDINTAINQGKKKGKLTIKDIQGTKVVFDEKYGFSISVPEGWEPVMQRDWQELLLKKSYSSISLFLYAKGRKLSSENIKKHMSKDVEYKEVSSQKVSTRYVAGYKVVYDWQYDNKVIHYYLIYDDFVLGIYGYGVTGPEIKKVFESFKGF